MLARQFGRRRLGEKTSIMFENRMPETFLAQLPEALRGVDFPASRDDIVEMAQMNAAEPTLIDRLKDLPERDYDNVSAVLEEIGAS